MGGEYSRESKNSCRQEERPHEKDGKDDEWWWKRVSQSGRDPGIKGGKVMRSTCEKFSALYFYWLTLGLH